MLRVCVIGLGPIGNLHADIYKEDSLAELVGVCDIIPERAEKAGKRLGVPWYTDAQTMLRELSPDVCSVATGGYEYSSDHFEPTIQALEAGCHVLCEKPICNDIVKAQKMVDLAREKNLCFAIDLNHRFTPAFRTAKRWFDEGKIGALLFINMSLWIGKFQDFESPYYHLKALNPHSVNIMQQFGGQVEKVQCFAMKAPGRTIWSTASINMKFKNGAVGHLTSSYDIERGHPMERCEVAGIRGRLVIEDMWREATLYPAGDLEKRVYTNPVFGGFRDFNDTFRDRIHKFLEEITNGVRPEDIDGSGVEGLEAQRVIEAAIRSLDTGKIIDVEDVR
ncbi:MAG TPA: Gfo/Idh/MocA family oxidoreductase [bacterium]|jgi:predicted dehydrogenase|nr:Gfo/Idh/MocA family oxidoreductase [Dictyoglomota bacterium]HHV81259.1 Gfo/Idh/MocA family oxidoreductase [bacterium]HOL55135.1 Gfo/Idh/MocA family oxidoreductase [bacterium]HON71815.1 Gfo/Idh/MocA family oxidoreductase [bacterium]HPO82220.1 Gfo/Idh/MocA family oxidoreductase [bacterium]